MNDRKNIYQDYSNYNRDQPPIIDPDNNVAISPGPKILGETGEF